LTLCGAPGAFARDVELVLGGRVDWGRLSANGRNRWFGWMPRVNVEPLLWGLVAASSLPLGAAAGCWLRLPQRVVAAVMAFGSGTLVAGLSLVLMQDAYFEGGLAWSAVGFAAGALAYTVVDLALERWSARRRRGHKHDSQGERDGLALAAGATLDNVPEMIVLGLGLVGGGGINSVMLTAIIVSNFPEALASAVDLKRAGRGTAFVLGMWCLIAVFAAAAVMVGYLAFSGSSGATLAVTNAIAAGALLAMIADSMIPQAYQETHAFNGLVTAAGFLLAFLLEKSGG
jgi:ZIP family zinc transporter